MLNDIRFLLRTIYKYISNFSGPLDRAFHFPHGAEAQLDLSQCAPHLLHYLKADTYVFHVHQPIKYIYLLLDGKCCVEKYNHSGHLFTDSTREAIQMFGLLESAVYQKYHTASMKCITECIVARIPVPYFMQIIRSDPELMLMSMQHLCYLFLQNVENTDQLMLDTPKRSILMKLYHYCQNQTFPVTILTKKEELAHDLNMNLRTLYRYLDKLYDAGTLSSHKGKITITQEQYQMIEEELLDHNP